MNGTFEGVREACTGRKTGNKGASRAAAEPYKKIMDVYIMWGRYWGGGPKCGIGLQGGRRENRVGVIMGVDILMVSVDTPVGALCDGTGGGGRVSGKIEKGRGGKPIGLIQQNFLN